MSGKSVLRGTPVVCAVRDYYLICVPVNKKVLMKITVNGKDYFCHSNGIRISDTSVQKFKIPMAELDFAKKYTVNYEVINLRTPYYCEKEAPVDIEYDFKPVEKNENINIYHLSDVHGIKNYSIKAGKFFGKDLDLLILNGDIASSSAKKEDIMLSFDIASAVTGGTIPCIISRGNHDLRGKYAEKLEEFLPTDNGNSYYSVKLGSIWFLLLDCGEDKDDSHREYSGTVCCHQFRLEQYDYIKELRANADTEYNSDKFIYKIILSHVPFNFNNTEMCKNERPFDIEHGIFGDWCNFAREDVKADFLLAGHYHRTEIVRKGSELDMKNIGCDTVIGSRPLQSDKKAVGFIGCAITLSEKNAKISFTDDKLNVLSSDYISFE